MTKLEQIANEPDTEVTATTEVNGTEKTIADQNPTGVDAASHSDSNNPTAVETANTETQSDNKKRESERQYTDFEKAQYGFKKRLERQQRQYEKQLAEMRSQIDSLKNPNRPKTREDFANDEEFVRDYMQNVINETLKKRDEEWRANYEQRRQVEANINSFKGQIDRDFGSIENYNNVVDNALEAGLSELIENNPSVKSFIQTSDNAAKVLFKLATDQNAVNKIFSSRTDWDMFYNLKRLEESCDEWSNPFAKQAMPQVTQQPANTPVLGKVGTNSNTNTAAEGNWEDPNYLRNLIRR